MLDVTADFFLAFAAFHTIFFVLMTGALFFGWRMVLPLGCLICIELIINVALKGTFRVPLSERLHSIYYAFPSGHMQLATVFYLWWAVFVRSWFIRVLIAFILIGVGAGLLHYGFHNLLEVIGGFIAGIIIFTGYLYFLGKSNRYTGWMLLGFSFILMIYNQLIYSIVPSHARSAFYVLLALIIMLELLFKNKELKLHIPDKYPNH